MYIECGWASTACENLSPPANGRVDISSLEPETTVRYSCNVGFQLSGNGVRTCLESGLWSGQEPSCTVQSCSSLSHPPNGNVEFPDTTVSSIATYTCHVGFTLAGNARRKCIGAGKWSGEAPNCTKHSCPPLSPPSNGKVMFSDTRPFSSTTYTCDVGFQLIGSARRICTRALTWSEEDPICIKLRCPTLLPPSNGHVSLMGLGPLQASYTCDSGFSLVGQSVRTCEQSGKWSGEPPVCVTSVSRTSPPKSDTSTSSSSSGKTCSSLLFFHGC